MRFFRLLKGHTPMRSTVTPHAGWWNYIEGTEAPFKEVETLYHALGNPDARLKEVSVDSSNRLALKVECGESCAFFDLDVIVKNDPENDRLIYLRDIIRFAKRRNKVLGRTLSSVWMHHLKDQEEMERLATG